MDGWMDRWTDGRMNRWVGEGKRGRERGSECIRNLNGDAFPVMNLCNCSTESRLKVFVENSSSVWHAIDEHGGRHQTEGLSVHKEAGSVEVAKVNLQ